MRKIISRSFTMKRSERALSEAMLITDLKSSQLAIL
jgi:hypothetical protein